MLHGRPHDREPVEREHEQAAEHGGQRHRSDGDAGHELGAVEGVEAVLEQPGPGGAEEAEGERTHHEPHEAGVGGGELAALQERAHDDVARRRRRSTR